MASGSPGRSKRASLTRLWGIRLAVVLAAGLAMGAAAGVVAVNTLEPGRPSEPDSLQLLLDSIAKGTAPVSTSSPSAIGGAASPASTDSSEPPPPDTAATNDVNVPDLIGLEEGIARVSLHSADLTVGAVEFRPSASPVGTVLATVPVLGTPVARRTPITLVLSDGRPPVDTSASLGRSTTP
jgi:hypothetical protein